MKKIKWLRKLPVLFLALILAFSPLLFVAPAHASSDILTGPSSDYPGYVLIGQIDEWRYFINYNADMPLNFVVSDFPMSGEPAFGLVAGSLFINDSFLEVSHLLSPLFYSIENSLVHNGSSYDYLFTVDYSSPVVLPDEVWQIPLGNFVLSVGHVVVENSPSAGVFWHYETLPLPDSTGPGILSVFSGVGSWFSSTIQSVSTMFWTAESGLSVLGYLAVASLALAVILLLLYLIAGWLKFR